MKRRNVRDLVSSRMTERLHNKAYNRMALLMDPVLRSEIRMATWYRTDVIVDDNVLLQINRNLSHPDPVQ